MPTLNIQAAFEYYAKHINRTERFDLLRQYNLKIPGSIPSVDWELFGAILTGMSRRTSYGADLGDFEVKSALVRASFEYQYHFISGIKKLDEDMLVDHIFISYSKEYLDVTVRLVHGKELAPTFEEWRPALIANYQGPNRSLRFRRSISYGTVYRIGNIIMQIKGGSLVVG